MMLVRRGLAVKATRRVEAVYGDPEDFAGFVWAL